MPETWPIVVKLNSRTRRIRRLRAAEGAWAAGRAPLRTRTTACRC